MSGQDGVLQVTDLRRTYGEVTALDGLSFRITGLSAAILIYIIIIVYGIRITIGVGEEKGTRVVEVLLTTLRPVQLLAGKVIGQGLLALAQIIAMVGLYLGVGHALGSNVVSGPATGVVLAAGLWLVLGYAFYCTAYAAAGSLITRQSDAYNAAIPLQLPLILAYVLTYGVVYAITIAGTVWMARLAGTIYSRAILRTGTRLKVRQVLKTAS